jgi:hypothetical protein
MLYAAAGARGRHVLEVAQVSTASSGSRDAPGRDAAVLLGLA